MHYLRTCAGFAPTKKRKVFSSFLKTKFKTIFLGLFSIYIICASFVVNYMGYAHAGSNSNNNTLSLNINKWKGARVSYKGISTLVSIGGFFEYYKRNLTGSRERIVSGPWRGILKGKLAKKSPDEFSLSGSNENTGTWFSINYAKVDHQSIELTINFIAQNKSARFSYEIFKLNSDFYKGSKISTFPASPNDKEVLPVNPTPINERILLKNKQVIKISSKLCDIELTDMSKSNSIVLADFRNIPWDKRKSFYFGANTIGLVTGKKYTFKYNIKFLPSSLTSQDDSDSFKTITPITEVDNQLGIINSDDFDPTGFFSIPCKDEKFGKDYCRLSNIISISTDQKGKEIDILSRELSILTGTEIIVKPLGHGELPDEGIIITGQSKLSGEDSVPNQGFEIDINKKRIIIYASDRSGRLYGVYKLLSLLEQEKGIWKVQSGKFRDWPDLETRGMLIELLPPAQYDLSLFKKYIDALSRARVNLIVFWHSPQNLSNWKNSIDKKFWSKEDVAQIASYARSLHMDVWGGMKSKFNSKDFPELDIAEGSIFYNPFKEKSYQTLFSLYDEIIDSYSPSGILIGHDEIKGLSVYSKATGIPTPDILADAVKKIHKWLSSNGIKTIMAGDMLLDMKKWKNVGGAVNSRNPYYNSGSTHIAVDSIPKDVMIFDWHYNKATTYKTIKYFYDKGFKVFGGAWHNAQAACALAQSVKKYKGDGIIGTDFGFWRTLSPAATTLYSPMCGWTSEHTVTEDNRDLIALALVLKSGNHGCFDSQSPYPIESYANEFMLDDIAGDGKGFFDFGAYADLRNLKTGISEFNGVKFDIISNESDFEKNCMVVGFDNSGKSAPVNDITMDFSNQRVKALAFLHTCYIEEPDYTHKKIGQYIVEYDNGVKELIDLIQSWNITDIRSSLSTRHNGWTFKRMPQILIGSDLAWIGKSETGVPLNIQKYVWQNPYPKEPIKQIIFKALNIKQSSRIALVGLTMLQ